MKIDKTTIKNAKAISGMLGSIAQIYDVIDRTSFSLRMLLNPIKAKIIGKTIGNFMLRIFNSIPRRQIKLKMDGLFELIGKMLVFADPNSKYSIKRMKKAFKAKNGRYIGKFFSELIDEIPKPKITAGAMKSVSDILDTLLKQKPRHLKKIFNLLTEERGENIGKFIKEVISPFKSKTINSDAIDKMNNFFAVIGKWGMFASISIRMLAAAMTEKRGESINKSMKNLLKGFSDKQLEAMKVFSASMKEMSKAALYVGLTITIIAATIALFGFFKVVTAVVITVLVIKKLVSTVKKLAEEKEDVSEGAKAMKDIAIAAVIASGAILIISIAAVIAKKAGIKGIILLGAILLMFNLLVLKPIKNFAKEWKAEGEQMKDGCVGLSILLISIAVSIGIITYVVKNNSLGDIVIGLGIMALTIFGLIFAVKHIAKNNKDIKEGITSMALLALLAAGIAIIINVAIIPIGKKKGPAIIGLLIMAVVMTGLYFLTKMISKIKTETLMKALGGMAIMSLIVLILSLITLHILIPIGKKAKDAGLGVLVVGAEVLFLCLMVKFLSKVKG